MSSSISNLFSQTHIHTRWAKKLSATFVIAALIPLAPIWSQTISVRSNVVGQTPRVIGLNSGNYLPGSNTTTWWQWSGVNGARIFTSAPRIESVDDIAPIGDGVFNASSFLARREALRADPTNPTFINFAAFANSYATNESDFINYQYAYGELSSRGINPLAIINRTNGQFPFAASGADAWADRWEHWQHYYAQAFYLGNNFGVERYSMYNEPDHSSQSVTQADYLLRLQLASDAIQCAIADVNTMFGRELQVQILAPITAGASNEYFRRLDNSDTRDDQTGWGELVINNLHRNFLGVNDPTFQLIHTYAYQEYNHDGPRFARELSDIKSFVAGDAPDENIGFGLTEFNVHSNGVFDDIPETIESPSIYSRFGAILASLANEQPNELYLFKMSSNAEEDLQKNSIFHNSRFDAPYNTGSASAAAGILKLFNKAFVGAQSLLQEPSHNVNNLYVATSYNPTENVFFWFSASESNQNRNLQIDLSAWGIEPGTIIQVEEVGEGVLAEVTQRIPAPTNGIINITQAPQSALLLSAPGAAPDDSIILRATDDATISSAFGGNLNFGSAEILTAENAANSAETHSAIYIKFDTTQLGTSSVERAVLQLEGRNLGTDEFAITHVYAINNDNWNQSTINWSNAPNVNVPGNVNNLIAHNYVAGVGETAEFVGHLTVNNQMQTVAVDVTDYLRTDDNDAVSFLLVREVRFDGENVDGSVSRPRFSSTELAGDVGPRLLVDVSLSDILLGDVNGDGLVDLLDVQPFVNLLLDGGFIDSADINRDGIVNLLDVSPFVALLIN